VAAWLAARRATTLIVPGSSVDGYLLKRRPTVRWTSDGPVRHNRNLFENIG
jgi:hypothetical protein